MTAPNLRSLARRLARLEKAQLDSKKPSLGFSTIDGGALQAANNNGDLTMVIGQQHDGTNTASVITGPTPPTPTIPLVTTQPGALRVYWDGTYEAAATAPMDFARVTVHAEPLATFGQADATNQANIIGSIDSATGGEITAALDAGVEYAVYLFAWSQAGKFSVVSDVAPATPDAMASGADVAAATAAAAEAQADAAQAAQDASDAQVAADAAQAAASTANTTAAQAQSDANAATAAAAAAQAVADGAIRTYYQPERPWADNSTQPDTTLGDLWYDSDNDQAYRWNGTIWKLIEDSQIAAALAAAQQAQSDAAGAAVAAQTAQTAATSADTKADEAKTAAQTAHDLATTAQTEATNAQTDATAAANAAAEASGLAAGKGKVWFQTSPPAGNANDLWIDTTSGANTPKRWSGTAWVAVTDKAATDAATAAANAATAASTAQTAANNAATAASTAQTTANNAANAASAAQTTASNAVLDAGAARAAADDAAAAALLAKQTADQAQATADGKIVSFYQGTPPTAEGVGDLWYNIANGNAVSRWDGSAWVPALIGSGAIAAKAVLTEHLKAGSVTTDILAANAVTADILRSGSLFGNYALVGKMDVGNITMGNPVGVPGDADYDPGGILINLSNGGRIQFPGDGSDATIQALLDALSLVVRGNMRIQGQSNQIEGSVALTSYPVAPSVKPQMATRLGDDSTTIYVGTWSEDLLQSAWTLTDGGDGYFYTIVDGPTGYHSHIAKVSKATGSVYQVRNGAGLFGSNPNGDWAWGMTRIGSYFYVLTWEGTGSSVYYYVQVYDAATWTLQRKMRWTTGDTISGSPVIGRTYNGNLMIGGFSAYSDGTWFFEVLTESNLTYQWRRDLPGTNSDMTALFYGTYDYSDYRFVVGTENGADVWNVNNPAAKISGEKFVDPIFDVLGVEWDGADWWYLCQPVGSQQKQLRKLSRTTVNTTRSGTWTLFDSNPDGSGQHETKPSPAASVVQTARSYLLMTAQPIGSAGGIEDPDSVRFYVDGYRQTPDSPVGAITRMIGKPTLGPAAPTVEGFATVPGLSLGTLKSQNADTSGKSLISFEGNGRWRLGDLSGDATGKVTNADDTGWVPLSLNAGFADFGTSNYLPAVRRIGNRVIMKGLIKPSSGSFVSGTVYNVFTLPVGFRTNVANFFSVQATNTYSFARLLFGSNGAVQVQANGAVSYISLDCSWLID